MPDLVVEDRDRCHGRQDDGDARREPLEDIVRVVDYQGHDKSASRLDQYGNSSNGAIAVEEAVCFDGLVIPTEGAETGDDEARGA